MDKMKKENDSEIEIDLIEILMIIKHNIISVIVVGIIFATIAFLFTELAINPVYESTTTLYVINRQDEGTTTMTDLQSATQLTSDYMILVKSRTVMEEVISELKLKCTADVLANSITVSNPTNSRILQIVVKDGDQYKAKEIADKVAEVSAKNICSIMQIEEVTIMDPGNIPLQPVEPRPMINTLVSGVLGMIIVMVFVIVKVMMNDTIRTSADVEKYLGLSTLAIMPLTEEEFDGHKSKKKRGRRKPRVRRKAGKK